MIHDVNNNSNDNKVKYKITDKQGEKKLNSS